MPSTYPSSAAWWLRVPPAARRAGPRPPRSQCWAAAPPVHATSAPHPGPPCACPALREPAQPSLGVPLPPPAPSLWPPAQGTQGTAPTCEGGPGEPVAGGPADGLPGQQHALCRHVVNSQVLHSHGAPCGDRARGVPHGTVGQGTVGSTKKPACSGGGNPSGLCPWVLLCTRVTHSSLRPGGFFKAARLRGTGAPTPSS